MERSLKVKFTHIARWHYGQLDDGTVNQMSPRGERQESKRRH